jgi:hypothetical protein
MSSEQNTMKCRHRDQQRSNMWLVISSLKKQCTVFVPVQFGLDGNLRGFSLRVKRFSHCDVCMSITVALVFNAEA